MPGPWLRLFRVPNLPTAVGDAVAGGAAVAFAVGRSSEEIPVPVVAAALAAGAAELLLYLGGLADNDLVDEAADRAAGKDRPLAAGQLPRRAVRAARNACFAAAAAVGVLFRLGAGWWTCAAAVAAAILVYDRVKERLPRLGFLLMGLCRGLAVASGAAAAHGAMLMPVIGPELDEAALFLILVLPMVLGWTLYTAGVTWLGAGEERAAAPLGRWRYLPALTAFVPVWLVFPAIAMVVTGRLFPEDLFCGPFVPFFGCGAAVATWCAAVAPLGKPHGPAERGRAVGRTIGGLLWMQTGFLCFWSPGCSPVPAFIAVAALCWIARFAVRRAWPAVAGS